MFVTKRRTGFTLIELLVVIAIIAILAAILFPVLMSAKRRAQMGACQCHLKQAITAILMYSDDNNGYLPMSHWGPTWESDATTSFWGKAIRSYCSSKRQVLYCPSVPSKLSGPDWFEGNLGWQYYWGTTIGMNVALGMDANGAYVRPTNLSEIVKPKATIVLGDSSLYSYSSYDPLSGHWAICPGSSTTLGRMPYLNPWPSGWPYDFFDPKRHNGRINIAWADGHVGSHDREWLLTPHAKRSSDPDYCVWDVNAEGSARLKTKDSGF